MGDVALRAMGTDVRLIGEDLDAARMWLAVFERALTRFSPDSDLSHLNADPRPVVPVSPLLRGWLAGALWAARRTGGLVDPTLGGEIVAAGYARSLAGVRPAPLREALAAAPRRRPAAASDRWRSVRLAGAGVRRPPGLRLDSGGTGKGMAADHLARLIGGTADCGGDVRVLGRQEVHVVHPFTGDACERVVITDGAIATSGIDARVWRRPDGTLAHHLLDPATGEPAWTGLVSATALAPTALEAEALAKAALLSGSPRPLVHGGLVVRDDGDVIPVGRLLRRVCLPRPAVAA
jgi:thiamine biosynthesis lipoprotein